MEEKPNYYSIIPATVRYDSNLKANEKLLYGEITALCNKKGVCWATNKYFADLYDVDIATISRWINNLIDNNYLDVEYENDNTRLLIIKSIPIDEKINRVLTKKSIAIDEKVKHNNKYNNTFNNINNKEEIIKEEINLFDYYQNELGNLSPNQFELLNSYINDYGEDKVKEAIDISCNNNVKTFNYFSSVLKNDTYQKKKENFKKDNIVPSWMDKENKREEISDKELEDLEKEFEIFS